MPDFQFRYYDRGGGVTIVRHRFDTLADAVEFTSELFDSEKVELWHGNAIVAQRVRAESGEPADGETPPAAR